MYDVIAYNVMQVKLSTGLLHTQAFPCFSTTSQTVSYITSPDQPGFPEFWHEIFKNMERPEYKAGYYLRPGEYTIRPISLISIPFSSMEKRV